MSKALQSNQTSWQSKYTSLETNYRKYQIEKEGEINELKDQIRDLMFYMEAQNTIANSDLKDEIATSSISVPQMMLIESNAIRKNNFPIYCRCRVLT